jgi:hypothetical protein
LPLTVPPLSLNSAFLRRRGSRISLGGSGWRRAYGAYRRRGRTIGSPLRPRSAATVASTCFHHSRSAAVGWSGGRSAARPPATSSHLGALRGRDVGDPSRSRVSRPALIACRRQYNTHRPDRAFGGIEPAGGVFYTRPLGSNGVDGEATPNVRGRSRCAPK